MADPLIEEAKRLSDQLVFVSPGTPHETAEWIDAARATMRELVERLEQAEQSIEMAQHHFRQIDEQHLSDEPPPQAFWDRLNAIRKALAAHQREAGDG